MPPGLERIGQLMLDLPGLPRDQFSGPWLLSTAEARTINSSSSKNWPQLPPNNRFFNTKKRRSPTPRGPRRPRFTARAEIFTFFSRPRGGNKAKKNRAAREIMVA